MQLANTPSRYGAVSQNIHWLTAVLVVALLISGKAGEIEAEASNALYFWHSSLGLSILLLVVVRVIWHFASPPPKLPATMLGLARGIARAFHVLFYVLLIALPLSGWMAASAEGGPVTFFGFVAMPALGASQPTVGAEQEEDAELTAAHEAKSGEEFWEEAHEVLGNLLLIAAILHVLAAFKHHLVDRDEVLRRMLPRGNTSALKKD